MNANILWQCFYFFGLCALFILILNWKKPFVFLWGYAVINALYFLFRPFMPPFVHPQGLDKLQAGAGQALAGLLIIPLFFIWAEFLTLKSMKAFFILFGATDCLVIWVTKVGLLNGTTFNGAFLAMLLPLCPWPLVALFFVTILKTKGLTALTVLMAEAIVMLKGVKRYLALGTVMLSFLFVWSLRGSMTFFFGFERMSKWKEFYEWWLQTNLFTYIFGSGAGSYFVLSPVAAKYHGALYLQAHNDFIQCLFEFGAIGLLLFLASFIWLFINASHKNRVLLAGMATCMLSYYPMHHLVTACFCAFVVRRSLGESGI